MNNQPFHDPYLRKTSDIKCRIGCTAVDEARLIPGPSLPRTYEVGGKRVYTKMCRDPEEILCRGAAAAIGPDGVVRHVNPHIREQQFVGFVEQNHDHDDVTIWTRGIVVLRIEGATEKNMLGKVYCNGPNSFNLSGYGLLLGVIRYVQGDGVCSISFKRHDDPQPYDISIH